MDPWKTELEEILRQIPGYNPWDQAGSCWLDHEAALKAINWFAENLKHIEGTSRGEPFILKPWQAAGIGNTHGWKRHDEAGRVVRRYRKVLWKVARGNGKTPIAAGEVLYVFFEDGEAGAQNRLAAGQKEQAGILFRNAIGMVDQNADLSDRITAYRGDQHRSIILKEDPLSFVKVIPADAAGQHGGIPHITVIDELHAQESRDLLDVFETAMAKKARSQPLLVMITTSDFDRPSICNEVDDYAHKVRDNGGDPAKPGFDPYFLPIIYEVPQDADWTDEKEWIKANPNIGVSVSLESLREACKKAQEQPAFENAFRRLHLNQKTSQDVRVIPMKQWDACKGELPDEMLVGSPCYGGMDLASTEDLASVAKVWRLPDGKVAVKWRCYCPEDRVRDRARKRIPYDVWHKQKHLTATDGSGIDYDLIKNDFYADAEKFEIRQLGYDSWGADGTRQDIEKKGFECVKIPQSFAHLSAPLKELLRLIREGQLIHDGNPVARWAASNLAVHFDGRLDVGQNIMEHLDRLPIIPSKRKSADKIDPMQALIIAIGRMMGDPQKTRSVYEGRGLLTLSTP